MKRSTRIFLTVSLGLMLGGTATCYFGERYVVNQIPAAVRAQMEDTDWVGFEWVVRGTSLFLLGACVGALPPIIYLTKRLRFRWSQPRG